MASALIENHPSPGVVSGDFLPQTQLATLIEMFAKPGPMLYDDLITSDYYPPFWDDDTSGRTETSPERIHNHEVALNGLQRFMQVFTHEFAQQAGVSAPHDGTDLIGFGDANGLIDIMQETGSDRIADANEAHIPLIAYQTPRSRSDYVGETQFRQRASFLHFGVPDSDMHNPGQDEPGFTNAVRAYLNPRIEDTPEVAAYMCEGFIAAQGYMPRGKFLEDATSRQVDDRTDRLIFWAKNPWELTVITGLARTLSARNPEIFEGRQSMILGEAVYIDDEEVPTLRLAQEPRQYSGDRVSFNSESLDILRTAWSNARQAEPELSLDNPRFSSHFKQVLVAVATGNDRNPASFAFNKAQDLGVINDAIAEAARISA